MHILMLLISAAALLPRVAQSEYIGAGAPSGAQCRVFVLATHEHSRFVLIESHVDSDRVDIYDDFPVATPALNAVPLEDVYKKLRPSFLAIQAFLLARPRPLKLEPRHCHTHLIAAGAAMRALDTAELAAIYARVHEETIEDAQFPFLFARDDLRTVSAELQTYFHVVGANYLAAKIPATLSPGIDELFGLVGFDDAAVELVFDIAERWRRSKRSKQRYIPLNTSDFFTRAFDGFGATALSAAVYQQLAPRASDVPVTVVQHPCYLPGYTRNGTAPIHGIGNANACLHVLHAVVDASNAKCRAGSYCPLSGLTQPRPFGSFYSTGHLRAAVLFASAVLAKQKPTGDALALPTPTLAALRTAADRVCALRFETLLDAKLAYAPARGVEHACVDLCYAVVLLEQFGIQDDDTRVHFALPNATASASTHALDADLATWLTGAFLYLEALQQRKSFALEADLLAVQVDEGVPIGFNLSVVLLVAALAFVYATSSSSSSRGSRGRASSYERVGARGKSKASPPHDSTQAILFVDDASE